MKKNRTPFAFLNSLLGLLYFLLLVCFLKEVGIPLFSWEIFYISVVILLIYPFFILIKDMMFYIFEIREADTILKEKTKTLMILLIGSFLILTVAFLPSIVPKIICIFWIYAISSIKSCESGLITKLITLDFRNSLKAISPFHRIE